MLTIKRKLPEGVLTRITIGKTNPDRYGRAAIPAFVLQDPRHPGDLPAMVVLVPYSLIGFMASSIAGAIEGKRSGALHSSTPMR